MRIARVFPRRTRATPDDDLAFIGRPDLFPVDADAVHVSVTFTWDIPEAERLARAWEVVAPVSIGGPAMNTPGRAFEPGRYLKPGYVITSRGCPNRCWFCSVWRRDGATRELPITRGFNVLDDNLLACSEAHIRAVFDMLATFPKRTAQFTGGLEARRLLPWHADCLATLKPAQLFLAFDDPANEPFLRRAATLLRDAGLGRGHDLRCYVLCGFPKDTRPQAEARMHTVLDAGILPAAMLWRNDNGHAETLWRRFQREWFRPAIVAAKAKASV